MKVFLVSFHFENKFCLPFSLPKYVDNKYLFDSLRDFLDNFIERQMEVNTNEDIIKILKDSFFSIFGAFDRDNGFSLEDLKFDSSDIIDSDMLEKFSFLRGIFDGNKETI